MEKIKIAFVDFWPVWHIEDFITPILRQKFEIEIDEKNPDVLFHSIFNRMSKTPSYKCKKVLILAENWRPNQFNSDYSISFDSMSATNYRLPLWQMYWLLWPELKGRLFNRTRHEEFDRFCSFVVSNSGNQFRNSFFDELHSMERVHSYGKVRTNDLSLQRASQNRYWRDAKDEFFKEHRHQFAIAFENAAYPGYCTEKLMDAFLVGSLPIYWGDPTVGRDWNLNAFIRVTSQSATVEEVKKLRKDRGLFQSYYEEPVFTKEQEKKHLDNLEEFENWLLKIVEK